MNSQTHIKPSKFVYIFWPLLKSFLLLTIILSVTFIITWLIWQYSFVYILGISILYLIVYSFNIIQKIFQYKKLDYIISQKKIIQNFGGIFSSGQIELIAKNFTHITLHIPWIQNKLFQTGDILIESAGSGGTEIHIKAIKNPEKIYEDIQNLMKNNGFNLSKSNLIQKEKPHILGVILDNLKTGFSIILGIFIFLSSIIGQTAENIDWGNLDTSIAAIIFIVLISLIIIFFIAKSVIHILDAMKRVYYLWEDTIEYEDGFLTKNYSLIPIQNLTDSKTTQSFWEKVLGLYDIILSCQGSGPEIIFKNMPNGLKLDSNIDNLIDKSKSPIGIQSEAKETTRTSNKEIQNVRIETSISQSNNLQKQEKTSEIKTDFTTQIKPIVIKTILGSTVLLIPFISFPVVLPFILIGIIAKIVQLVVTVYEVNKNSFESKMSFLTTKNIKFSCDKVTGVIVQRGVFDRILNTCTIQFWSIGTYQDLKFANIKYDKKLIKEILKKTGIEKDGEFFDNTPEFDFSTFLKANLIGIFVIFVASLISILLAISNLKNLWILLFIPIGLGFGFLVLLVRKYISVIVSKLYFFKEYLYFKKGLLLQTENYVRYENIKDITLNNFLFSQKGKLQFNIAGEHIVQNQQNQQSLSFSKQSTGIASNTIQATFIKNINLQDELIDYILDKQPNLEKIKLVKENIEDYIPETIKVIKPSIGQAIVKNLFWLILLLPTVIGFFLALGLIIWSTSKTQYIIQSNRVLKKWGIFVDRQFSIIFDRIDHLNYSQGFWGKIFKTGNIIVNTTGSSKPELIIKNIPDYMEFFNLLEDYYTRNNS